MLVPEDGNPRTFEFRDGSPRTDGFQLSDDAHDAELDCRLPSAGGLPDLCTLSINGSPEADFDRIGFDRLGGRSHSGTPATLVRVRR